MSFIKDLFIINQDKQKEPTKFPTEQSPVQVNNKSVCDPYLDDIYKLYDKGFDSLNKDGVDFFEYFQSIVNSGSMENAGTYVMAFNMLKGLHPTISKESLLADAQFYITELEKVYQTYVDSGTQKRQQITQTKDNEEATLQSEINQLNEQIDQLNKLRTEKSMALGLINEKYTPQITEVDCKLKANEIAKNRIVSAIQNVVNGINNNLN
jgi:hypothetical protein